MTKTTLRDYLRNTEDAISAGRFDEAMANCQNILSYFPEALDAQRLLGEVYLAQGHLEEAQQTFDWILTNDPENVVVYCNRAMISERVSDIDTALDCYQQAYELSRSSHIRQEFNQLSARVGQQEFMFSRAGLARLYMRGDLLTQAIQEWDAVLSSTPDRLDARLGLMETYWREGVYDKVEQMANEIIEEIPTCLKALLLLAHVTSISNLQRARELVERAKTLDPELVMAESLFDDLAASQPNDPFLALLKKEPVFFSNGELISTLKTDSTEADTVIEPVNGHAQPSSLSPDQWGALENWSELDPYTASSQAPESPAQPAAGPSSNGIHNIDAWTSTQAEVKDGTASELELETWQPVQEGEAEFDPSIFEKQPWYQAEQFAASAGSDSGASWDNTSSKDLVSDVEAWGGETQHEEQPTPPAWLDSLTHTELRQHTGAMPAQPVRPAPPTQPAQALKAASTPEQSQKPSVPVPDEFSPAPPPGRTWSAGNDIPSTTSVEEDAAAFFLASDDSDNDMGWPEWLKSLGAATLEPEAEPESEPEPSTGWSEPLLQAPQVPLAAQASQPQPEAEAQPEQPADAWDALASPSPAPTEWNAPAADPWTAESDPWIASQSAWSQQPEQQPVADWLQQLSSTWPQTPQAQSVQPAQPAEQMQPAPPASAPTNSWLDQLEAERKAQEQRYISSLEDLEKSLHEQGFVPIEPGTLASIAQNQTWQSQLEPQVPTEPTQAAGLVESVQQLQPAQPPQEPSLSSVLAQFGNLKQPAHPGEAEQKPPVEPQWLATPAMPSRQTTSSDAALSEPAQAFQPSPMPQPVQEPAPASPTASATPLQETPLAPAYHADTLLDSELETTMKRPAIRLQPMQQLPGDKPGMGGRGRLGERKAVGKEADSNLSNRDRLLRGYQSQLAGAYDDAMQEYRFIIRNAPELLDEVISNVRALLKLAPRFSLGYRVLGDAYMRKGEYLQAMEAYNKALTMAKKARS